MRSGALLKLRLLRRRTLWCPTWIGWLCLFGCLGALPAWWFYAGEEFLALTRRESADVLVVEGWIGRAGMAAAKAEYESGGYQWIVATGGSTARGGWTDQQWSYAEMAGTELLRLGLPRDRVRVAASGSAETERTYRSAVAAREVIVAQGIRPRAVNVFTRGPHSRRSRLVFSRVFGSPVHVGVIAWRPAEDRSGGWWNSSERAKELVTETAGYWYEALAGSGRWIRGTSRMLSVGRDDSACGDTAASSRAPRFP